jgi:hypothetical protein
MSRIAGRVEELGDGVVLRQVGHAGSRHKPASGEISSSELNLYVVGGLRELAA